MALWLPQPRRLLVPSLRREPRELSSVVGGPLTLPGLVWGAELGKTALIQYNTQPGADLDMQTAGVANWANYSDATTRTKETASPPPAGFGPQYLHILHTGAGNYWGATHNTIIIGNRYTLGPGYMRAGTGVADARYQVGGVDVDLIAGNDTWILKPGGEFTAVSSTLQLFSPGSNASYLDYGGRSLVNNALNRQNPDGGSLGGYLAQADALKMPWASGGGIKYDTSDAFPHSALASAWKFLHYDPANGPTFYPTFMIGMSFTTPAAIVDSFLASTADPGMSIRLVDSRAYLYVGGTGQSSADSGVATIAPNTTYALVARSDGTNIKIQVSRTDRAPVPMTHTSLNVNPYETLNVGYASYHAKGAVGFIVRDCWVYNRQSDAAADALGRWMAARRGATW